MTPTPEDFAHSRLLSYAAYQFPAYQLAAHHQRIASHLEAVERGEITRLMITMPPRHGKSMLASEFFPAWYLGRNPGRYIIAASYAQELADDFGRKVRNQMGDPCFQEIFPGVDLAADSTSAKRFSTAAGGSYFASGIGGPVTGRGAHLLLIDDPVKNREDADSEIVRKRARDWYTSTAYTRLMPGGAIVVIQTRWHEDDLSGWLLTEHGHEGWVVLDLPAIDDQGQALWPEQYPLDRLHEIRKTIGPRDWSALYQQRPTPDTGEYFLREWVRYYDHLPAKLRHYGASDYAVTMDAGDFTEHGVGGVDEHDNLYLCDWWHGQTSPDKWIEPMLSMIGRWSPVEWTEESGPIQKSVAPFIAKRMNEERKYCALKQLPSVSDKQTRAQAIRGRFSQGRVFLPRTEWADRLVDQMMKFPNGKSDDGVDVLSLFGRILDSMKGPAARREEKVRANVTGGWMG